MRRIHLPKGYGDGSIKGGWRGGWGDEVGNGYGEGGDEFLQPCNWGTGDGGGYAAPHMGLRAGSGKDYRIGNGRSYGFGFEPDDYPHSLMIL